MESVCKAAQSLIIKDIGKGANYADVWELQENILGDILNKKKNGITSPNWIIICEHNSVYTIGRSFNEDDIKAYKHILNFLNTPRDIKTFLNADPDSQLTPCYYINRGGSITYHGPGQIVVYPIIDLASWHKDLHKYLRALEQAVICCLQSFNIPAFRIDNLTGVWVCGERKICSIGVRASSWVTMHGLALNVNTDMGYFDRIDPCGLKDRKATSMQEVLHKKVDIDIVKVKLIYYLKKELGFC